MSTDNPVERLYRILAKVLEVSNYDDTPTALVIANASGYTRTLAIGKTVKLKSGAKWPIISRLYSEFSNLITDAIRLVNNADQLEKGRDNYLEPLLHIEKTFQTIDPTVRWGEWRGAILRHETLTKLNYCMLATMQFCQVPPLPDDLNLEELQQQLEGLKELLAASNLEEDVKYFFIDNLTNIQIQMDVYVVRGASAFREIIELTLGARFVYEGTYKARTNNLSSQDQQIVDELWSVLGKVAISLQIFAFGEQVLELSSSGMPLLPGG